MQASLFPVMYTLYTSVSKFLPPTSYMKAIEWWLLFHILVPLIIFVVLFLQATIGNKVLPANSFFQEHTAKHMERQGLRWFLIDVCVPYYVAFGEVVLPFVISSFVIVYAFIMLMHYYEVMYSRWPGCSYFGDKLNMLHQWTRCKNYRLQIARNSQTQVCITKNVHRMIEMETLLY